MKDRKEESFRACRRGGWGQQERGREPVSEEGEGEKGNARERRGRTRYSGSLCNCPPSVV